MIISTTRTKLTLDTPYGILTADVSVKFGIMLSGNGGSVATKNSAYARRMHAVAAKNSDGIYIFSCVNECVVLEMKYCEWKCSALTCGKLRECCSCYNNS